MREIEQLLKDRSYASNCAIFNLIMARTQPCGFSVCIYGVEIIFKPSRVLLSWVKVAEPIIGKGEPATKLGRKRTCTIGPGPSLRLRATERQASTHRAVGHCEQQTIIRSSHWRRRLRCDKHMPGFFSFEPCGRLSCTILCISGQGRRMGRAL